MQLRIKIRNRDEKNPHIIPQIARLWLFIHLWRICSSVQEILRYEGSYQMFGGGQLVWVVDKLRGV